MLAGEEVVCSKLRVQIQICNPAKSTSIFMGQLFQPTFQKRDVNEIPTAQEQDKCATGMSFILDKIHILSFKGSWI